MDEWKKERMEEEKKREVEDGKEERKGRKGIKKGGEINKKCRSEKGERMWRRMKI